MRVTYSYIALAAFLGGVSADITGRIQVLGSQPNPPTWPDSVKVFDPSASSTEIQAAVSAAYAINGGHDPANHGQFSEKRYAFMFKPGTYAVDVPVGYYTQVLGLGEQPGDVVFTGQMGVYAEEGSFAIDGALSTFWRGAENFRTSASRVWATGTGMMWAVSQAAPLRRVDVDNELVLFEYQPPIEAAGEASGGFMADVRARGRTASGSQQQFLARNCDLAGGWPQGVWNMVFVGSQGAPAAHCSMAGGAMPVVNVAQTPRIVGKPFISVDASGLYHLNIPQLRENAVGPEWLDSSSKTTQVPFSQVYVADASKDSAASMNAALGAGLHLLLSPGIYQLDAPLQLQHAGQVLLGLGLATLVAAGGTPAVVVSDVEDVRVAGILLQAGPKPSATLLQWGAVGSGYGGVAAAPGVMSDVFARVGGADSVQVEAEVMIEVNSGNVIGDNLWLWRADHTASGLVYNSENPCTTGLKVAGNDVTMYGLAVEHTLGDLVSWTGQRGATYFYQSEYPYDVTQENYGNKDFVSYRVGASVTSHQAFGVGVYHYFRDYAVQVKTGISAPAALESSFVAPLGVFLNGLGRMEHVINQQGNFTAGPGTAIAYVC